MNNEETMRIIDSFTADDYRESSRPYEFLYKISSEQDKFQQMKYHGIMQRKAALLGVKNFLKLFKAYTESVKARSNRPIDKSTDFGEDQPLELLSREYNCSEYGVTLTRGEYEELVCCHPILPIQRLINIDTGEERLKIAYNRGRCWRYIIVEKSMLASATKILDLSSIGIVVTSANAKALGRYLLEIENINYDIIPEQQSVGRLGWISDGKFSPYVDGIVFDGDLSFSHIFESIKSVGDFGKWKSIMSEVRKSKFGRIILAASFSSALIYPCGLLPFFLHIWGETECGKTVGLMVAASVWGNPNVGDYITTFNSTAVAQELQAGFLNSLPMLLDELQIQASQGQRDFDKVIYQLTEGTGRSRGAKTGGLQRLQTWRNCFITSGEQPISNSSSFGGAVNRVIEFELTEKVYDDLPHLCNVIKNNYGYAGKIFVEWLQDESNFEEALKLQKGNYKKLLDVKSTEKQAASASAILTADYIINKIIFDDNMLISIEDISEIMTNRDSVNANLRALDYIYEFVARNPARFNLMNQAGTDYVGEVWGICESNCVYIIKSAFDDIMRSAGYNATAFLMWAKRNKKIKTNKDRTTLMKRIPNCASPVRCICLFQNQEVMDNEETSSFEEKYQDLPF